MVMDQDNLVQQKKTLSKSFDRHAALKSPTSRLPPEIVLNVLSGETKTNLGSFA